MHDELVASALMLLVCHRRAGEALTRPSRLWQPSAPAAAQPSKPSQSSALEVAADYALSGIPTNAPPQVCLSACCLIH